MLRCRLLASLRGGAVSCVQTPVHAGSGSPQLSALDQEKQACPPRAMACKPISAVVQLGQRSHLLTLPCQVPTVQDTSGLFYGVTCNNYLISQQTP